MTRISLLLACAWFAACLSAEAADGPAPPTDAASANDVIDILFVQSQTPFYLRLHVRRDGMSFRDLWSKYLDALFTDLDQDQNGQLNPSEAQQGPWSKYRSNSATRVSDLSTIDFDTAPRDEVISREELFGRLSRYAFSARFEGTTRVSRESDPLFMLLDRAPPDEQLANEESRVQFTSLRLYDRNDDELLSMTDVQPTLSSEGPNGFNAGRMRRETTRRVDSILARQEGETDAQFARRVFRAYDLESDRRLKPSEIALAGDAFAQADANGNGSLSTSEFTQWFETSFQPDLEVFVELDTDGAYVSTSGSAANVGADAEGRIVAKIGLDELVVRANVPEATAQQYAANDAQQFKSLDRDGNEYLDRMEVPGDEGARQLAAMDRDSDGKVFAEEFTHYMTQRRALATNQVAIRVENQGSTLFEVLDENGDRHLSQRELRRLGESATQWDRDGDGKLSLDEIPRKYQLFVQPEQPDANFGTIGVLFAFQVAESGASARTGPEWFQRMDRNGDGDVSPREYLGPIERFRALDADSDGLMSAQEAEAAK